MNNAEFAELVTTIVDRWGTQDEVWANPDRFADDFTNIDASDVFTALFRHMTDTATAKWPPRPPALRAAALEITRLAAADWAQQQLPDMATGTAGGLRQWITDTHGDPDLTIDEVIRRRHTELEGRAVTATEARTADEDAWIRDGHVPTIECRSAFCDIHREEPLVLEDALADDPVELVPEDDTPELEPAAAAPRDEAPW